MRMDLTHERARLVGEALMPKGQGEALLEDMEGVREILAAMRDRFESPFARAMIDDMSDGVAAQQAELTRLVQGDG